MRKRIVYKAVDGKEYDCRILSTKDGFADIQLLDRTDDSYFVKVPFKGNKHSYKPAGYLEVK